MQLELNGTNVINESERKGSPSSLFWPWCGANVSLLALSYGAFFLGFGISFYQATAAAILGTVLSFLLVGFSSLAGKKSNAPTMVLSRAAFGVKGNLVPGILSYLIFVGWETVLVSLATLATGTVFVRVGHIDRNLAMILGFIIAVALTAFSGVLGHAIIMKLQKWLTLVTVAATFIYFALTIDFRIHLILNYMTMLFKLQIAPFGNLFFGLGLCIIRARLCLSIGGLIFTFLLFRTICCIVSSLITCKTQDILLVSSGLREGYPKSFFIFIPVIIISIFRWFLSILSWVIRIINIISIINNCISC